jgi:hypothetical protein
MWSLFRLLPIVSTKIEKIFFFGRTTYEGLIRLKDNLIQIVYLRDKLYFNLFNLQNSVIAKAT